MKRSFLRRVFIRVGNWFGLHPEVGDLISGGFRLTNPDQADVPSENLNFASRLIASGLWNYCFFQFYRNFVGPYWVERQYNPTDVSFIPRAVSPLSINVTHRTWMGFRGPHSSHFAMMDPAGAVSPVTGYYSIEFAIREKGRLRLPARGEVTVRQRPYRDLPVAFCEWRTKRTRVRLQATGSGENLIVFALSCRSRDPEAELVVSVRPFNPEGATLIHSLAVEPTAGGQFVRVNGDPEIFLPEPPDRVSVCNLESGDAYFSEAQSHETYCSHGVGTATLTYRIRERRELLFAASTYRRDVQSNRRSGGRPLTFADGLSAVHLEAAFQESLREWEAQLARAAVFRSARRGLNRAARIMSGYLVSLRCGEEITPGSFTYRSFFFRDAAYMLPALIQWNLLEEARPVVYSYLRRQLRNGFFRSQKGEWDSTGQAIWTLMEYIRTTNDHELLARAYPHMQKGVRWIWKLRRKGPGRSILPPGFSAEHLGPADSYYWDNLWSIAGIRCAAEAARALGKKQEAKQLSRQADEFTHSVLEASAADRKRLGVVPPAPGRGIETGMIGSIAELYPLELEVFPRKQMRRTVATIYRRFFNRGLFFHHIIHSGFNVYLSLHVAQCFFRLGEVRTARRILNRVLKKRTPMWTYPEAIHPLTGGGVMGDGFHGWAFAEILLLIRRFTVYRTGDRLEIFQGLRKRELLGSPIEFGPFPMDGTSVTIEGRLSQEGGKLEVRVPRIARTPIAFVRIHLPVKGLTVRSVEGALLGSAGKGKVVLLNPEEQMRVTLEPE